MRFLLLLLLLAGCGGEEHTFVLNDKSSQITALEERIQILEERVYLNESNLVVTLNEMYLLIQEVSELADNSSLLDSISDLNDRVTQLESNQIEVVYPCGEGNSQEVLIKTPQGYLAYFQEGVNRTINFSASDVVPTHLVCKHWTSSTNCTKFEEVTGYTTNSSLSIQIFELKKAYLDILGDGRYSTTDGYSCSFTIDGGELQ
jgi:hypothetical protein